MIDVVQADLPPPPARYPSREHLSGYYRRDWLVVDYQMFQLEDTGLWFRGPRPEALLDGQFFTCLGAAQTFGCFCSDPFPSLLGKHLPFTPLNLGYGGAGPLFYLRHPELIEVANRGRFVILQVMSGRSESNSLFDSGGLEFLTRRSDGTRTSAADAYRSLLKDSAKRYLAFGRPHRPREFFFQVGSPAKAVVRETREKWIANYLELMRLIEVPVVLFYFSKRKPRYRDRPTTLKGLFNEFPQLVNHEMIDALRPHAAAYVECVTKRGSPQPLVNRFNGAPVTIDLSDDRPDLTGRWRNNAYYPSPEMHHDAAEALAPACEGF